MTHTNDYQRHQANKTNSSENTQNADRFASVKNSLQTCIGFMDGLCCASLHQVHDERREEKTRAHLRDFMASYDLGHLNSGFGETNSATGSCSSSDGSSNVGSQTQTSMTPVAKQESPSNFPSVEKGTTYKSPASSSPNSMMHTVVPNSMLPRDYGHSPSSQQDEETSSSCCHSFPQFHGMDCQHDSSYTQPHTLPSADTYTTVSMSHSYSTMMWDDDDEEDELNSDYVLSPVESVFRKDEPMEVASLERDGPPCAPSFADSAISKTHEAYQYLLRMKSHNYLHGSGSSEDLEYRGGNGCDEFDLNYRTGGISEASEGSCGALFLQ